ncbi:hypothetical protein J5N97_009847 [Dioscorea zingiberensis]|uniref:Uncharacterized protein n=1 Tax=Dioscorea zingiberensis TaxID=325984 RepID=A0A9D5CZ30_9LILI|nr:hypothetical protein J5N97_009847 [Dioscorea zingiberensis]
MSICFTKSEIIAGSVDGTVRTFDIRIWNFVIDWVQRGLRWVVVHDEVEWKKVAQMRALVEDQDLATKEKFTIIADLQGWGYSNCDIRGYLAGLDILQVSLDGALNYVTKLFS